MYVEHDNTPTPNYGLDTKPLCDNVDESLQLAQAEMGLEVRRPIVDRAVRSRDEKGGRRFANHWNSRCKRSGCSEARWPVPGGTGFRISTRQNIHKPGRAETAERDNLCSKSDRQSAGSYAR
jgi:hypothetical protein